MNMNEDDYLEHLILSGAAEFAGLDPDTGEMLYSFTNKLESVSPHLYKRVNESFYQEILSLWQLGFLEMNMLESNPEVMLTKKAFDTNEISKLDNNLRVALRDIIRAYYQKRDQMGAS